jgi:hypothetical protein
MKFLIKAFLFGTTIYCLLVSLNTKKITNERGVSDTTSSSSIPNGWFNIVGKTGLCASAKNKGDRVNQQRCDCSEELMWKAELHNGSYVFINKNGYTLDNYAQNKNNGNKTISYPRNNSGAQLWKVEKVNDANLLKNTGSNKCFDDTGKAEVGQGYHIWDCNKSNQNQWFKLKDISCEPKRLKENNNGDYERDFSSKKRKF